MELLLGMKGYMCEQNYYPTANFSDIRISLKFQSLQAFLEAVRMSRSFGVIADTERKEIVGIYSPFIFTGDAEEIIQNARKYSIENEDNLHLAVGNNITSALKQQMYNILFINNIFSSCSVVALKSNNYGAGQSYGCAKPEADTEQVASEEDVKAFFHQIKICRETCDELYGKLMADYRQQYNDDGQEAREFLIMLVQCYLTPYFTGSKKFKGRSFKSLYGWVSNLMRSDFGKKMIANAARDTKRQRIIRLSQQEQKKHEESRANHPLGEHEWTDIESGQRFYEDSVDGKVRIPEDAEPRPSDTAQWNVMKKKWM